MSVHVYFNNSSIGRNSFKTCRSSKTKSLDFDKMSNNVKPFDVFKSLKCHNLNWIRQPDDDLENDIRDVIVNDVTDIVVNNVTDVVLNDVTDVVVNDVSNDVGNDIRLTQKNNINVRRCDTA